MRLAVLGMGSMGTAFAGRALGGGHRVTVWNRTPGRADELLAAGAEEAGFIKWAGEELLPRARRL